MATEIRPAEPTPYQAYIYRLIETLQEILMLQEFEIMVEFDPEDDDVTRADIFANIEYLWAKIKIYPLVEKDFGTGEYFEIVETVLHELCHILTDPLYNVATRGMNTYTEPFVESIREQSTQRIARIILPLLSEDIFTP